MKQTYYK